MFPEICQRNDVLFPLFLNKEGGSFPVDPCGKVEQPPSSPTHILSPLSMPQILPGAVRFCTASLVRDPLSSSLGLWRMRVSNKPCLSLSLLCESVSLGKRSLIYRGNLCGAPPLELEK